jgi:uncharacterized membrane protein SpoIIM required for sporulation
VDYARFLRTRRPLWEDFARRLERLPATSSRTSRRAAAAAPAPMSYAEIEALAFSYRQVLHDHALASNRFAGTGAARQLAALALAGTRRLTRRPSSWRGLRHFFLRAFPAAFNRQLGLVVLAGCVFAGATLFGLALAAVQPALGNLLLGPRAIARLEEGRLWTESLTSAVPPAVASSHIASNNMAVALTAWTGGVLAGVIPFYIMVLNGLMLGGVLGVTLRYSMGGEFLGFVAAHGPLEISLLVVAAASGLALGRALVAVGDRPRAEAMRQAGIDSLRVMLGCLPWFVVLGVVEARLSPDPSVPVAFKAVLGLCLEMLFLATALGLHPYRSTAEADANE